MSIEKQEQGRKANEGPNDEIDLRIVLAGFMGLFSSIWNGFIIILIWLKKITIQYSWVLTLFVAVGIGAAFSYRAFVSSKGYMGTMIIRSEFLNGSLLENYLEKLNRGPEQLSKILQIKPEMAASIVGFEAEPFVTEGEIIEFELLRKDLMDKVPKEDLENIIDNLTLENRSTYKIHVRVLDPEVLDNIQEPLWRFIREIPYIKKRLENEKRMLLARKEKINRDTQKLDSLKNVLIANLSDNTEDPETGSNNVILGERGYTDPLAVFREELSLFYQEESAKEQLFLEPKLEIIDGLTPYGVVNELDLTQLLIISALAGLALGYLIIFLIGFNKYLVAQEHKFEGSGEPSS